MKRKSSPSLRIKLKLLEEDKHPSQHAIRSTGVLAGLMPGRSTKGTRAAIDRTEQLLRLLANAKSNPRKRRFGLIPTAARWQRAGVAPALLASPSIPSII